MTGFSINPAARKAVLIMEAEDGSVVVANIFDPRIDRDFPEYDFQTTRLSAEGVNRLTFSTGKMFMTTATDEDGWAHSQKVYDDASIDYPESFPLAARADAEQIKAWSEARHMSATHAVYLAGVAAGAKQVQFHDERIEKEIAEAPLRGIEAVQRELRMLTATKSGKPVQKGLRRALKLAEQVRATFAKEASK